MYIVDITTTANYFGRVTGITRVELQVAHEFLNKFPQKTKFVYWSNDKNAFEEHKGDLGFENVKASKLSNDFSCSHDVYFKRSTISSNIPDNSNFVVTGSGWLQNSKYALGCISFAREHKLKLTFYIHDLIPLKFPYYYDTGYVRAFSESLTRIVNSGALLMCNSKNTEKDLLEWCHAKGLPEPSTAIAYLGDSIITPDTTPAIETRPQDENYVLTVGAMHRRKNYELLASTWRRLHARLGGRCPKLKIVGGVTPDGKILHSEIMHDPILKDKIQILSGIDDHTLENLYRNAALVVYPSHYEGWGLPVAEALAYGKVCLASNTSAIPEIADLGPDFLEPDDPVTWASRIMFYCQNPQQRVKREEELKTVYQPRTWADTVQAIATSLKEHSEQEAPVLFPGEIVAFNTPQSEKFIASPCYSMESWGRWCTQSKLKLRFSLPEGEREELILKIEMNARANVPGRIILNNEEISSRPFSIGMRHCYQILPKRLLQTVNEIEIKMDFVTRLPDVKKGDHAKRYSAFGVKEFGIFTQSQVKYDLRDRYGNEKILQKVPLKNSDEITVLSGRDISTGIQSNNGSISLVMKKGFPQLWDLGTCAFFKVPKNEQSLVLVRVNGTPIAQQKVTSNRQGEAGIAFTIPSGTEDLRSLEFFLLSGDTTQRQNGSLIGLFAPQIMLEQSDVLTDDQNVSEGDFLKFGADIEAPRHDIFEGGWNLEERFGVSCNSTGLMTLHVDGTRPVHRLKINGKTQNEHPITVQLRINGIMHEKIITRDLEAHIFNLTNPLQPGDVLSVTLFANNGPFVLRSMQLLREEE